MKQYSFIKAVPVWEKGTEEDMNRWLIFKCRASKADSIRLCLTGSCFYSVYVDGEFRAFGPARCAHGYYRVDELDLTDCADGDSVIAIVIAGYNCNSFYAIDQPSFLTAELICDGEVTAATGANGFTCNVMTSHEQKAQRYSWQRAFSEVYNFNADPKASLAALDEYSIETERTDDKKYIERGCAYEHYEIRPAARIVRRGKIAFGDYGQDVVFSRHLKDISPVFKGYPISALRTNVLMYTRNIDTLTSEATNEKASSVVIPGFSYAIAEFDRDTTGKVAFDVSCKTPVTVLTTFDETLTDKNGFPDVDFRRMGATNAMIFRLNKGSYSLSTFEPYTYKYLKFHVIGGEAEISNIHAVYFGADNTEKQFVGDDDELKLIYDAAVETYRQNTFTIFMDCPSRERAGWLCDSFFTARVERLLTGKSEIEHNFLENFLLPDGFKALPDGMLSMCYPADCYNGNFIPNWAMWYVLELDEYFDRTYDRAFVDTAKPAIYKLIEYLSRFEDEFGLLEKLDNWVFIDWSESNKLTQDVNFPTNMLYSRMLSAVGKLYGDMDAAEKAVRINAVVNEMSYIGPFYCDNAVRVNGKLTLSGKCTESCQNYAFFCGTATPESRPELFRILIEDFGPQRSKTGKWPEVYPANAFIGNYIRLEFLSQLNEREKLLENIRGFFLPMAQRTGTLWENNDVTGSLCHGFASHVLIWLDKLGYVK